jgi:signal transduction histidine kinase
MRRLYLQIYLSVVGILLLFTLLISVAWLIEPPSEQEVRLFEGIGAVVSELLPGPDRPVVELQASLERFGERLSADLGVWTPDGALLASVGEPLPAPAPDRTAGGLIRARGGGPSVAIRLPDGRWLVARHAHQGRRHGWLAGFALLALVSVIGAYPVVRRITRRLERLQTRVDELGAGDLGARVDVEGSDEVADLARSFNRAAARIERLVNAQRTLLASASHELRTPLTRIRVAIELLGGEDRPELRERVSKDIAELDELIGELLLASRLARLEELEQTSAVDLLALVAEEAARTGAQVGGEPVHIQGDARMLRRLVRNLLENALRHGAGSTVEASVAALGETGARLRVADRGPGIPEAERERVFEPFYRPEGTRESADGVGLGLSLVRQIARHHAGDARCLAREGGGTCFEVDLHAP